MQVRMCVLVCVNVYTYARVHTWMKQQKQCNNTVSSRNHPYCGKAVLHILSVCVCSLSHSACKAHAPYYIVICGPSSSTMFFPHYLTKGLIFVNTLLNIKCVFWFSLQLVSDTFLIMTRIQRIIINAHTSSHTVPLFLSDFNKTSIVSTILWKILKYQISWNLSSGSQMRTDRHDETVCHFKQFD